MVACSIENDYETLSYWFDGVPKPEHLLTDEERAEREEPAEGPVVVRQRRVRPGLPEGFSRHEPYARKDCQACHVNDMRDPRAFGLPKTELRMPRGELCMSCHEAEQGAYVHGPSASGACFICHAPHQSSNPSLLRFKEQRELCVDCHSGPFFETEAEHEAYEGQDCTACHDPHASAHAGLLREPPE